MCSVGGLRGSAICKCLDRATVGVVDFPLGFHIYFSRTGGAPVICLPQSVCK